MPRKKATQPPAQNEPQSSAAATTETSEAELRSELEEVRVKAEDNYRSWQRSAADFANFKRRVDDEKRFAERWLLQDLLPVLDDFERAWVAAPSELMKLTWIEGLMQINAKLFGVLQRHGVTPIETEGKEFSPLEHEAVLREDEVDPAEQTAIVAQLQRGYRLNDRVLRPALVKVGKPKSAPSAEGGAGTAPTPTPAGEAENQAASP
jgi:molecular chaperone GrpE